jgi:DNA transformation protein
MPASDGFLELLRELLAPVGAIAVKRMFSGASIYADGVIFALVEDDVLYLKADQTTKSRFEEEGLGPFVYEGKTRPVAMSYWRVPERLYDDPDEMADWSRQAIAVARRAKAKPAKKSAIKSAIKKSGATEVTLPAKKKNKARKI